jgi:4-hydroxy-tetrahydrodipicolinate reductase
MGQMLIEAVHAAHDCAGRRAGPRRQPGLGQDAGAFAGWASGVKVTADLDAGLRDADC